MKENDIELEMPSNLHNVKIIRDFIKGFLKIEKISVLLRDQLISIIDELLTNIAEHAYDTIGNSKNSIKIILKKTEDNIKIIVEDFGKGLNNPENPQINSSKDRGLGLKIAEGLSDEFNIINKNKGLKIEVSKKIN